MKIKATPKKGSVVMELGSQDASLLTPLPLHLQRILVPVDFSDTARKALQYAIPFAVAFDAELILVHVVQPCAVPSEFDYLPVDYPATQGELLNSARDELERLCAEEIGRNARSQVALREGSPWHEIVTVANEMAANLIILATHGRTGLRHVLLGSVTERVVRHAPCPVLVVRNRERDFLPAIARGQEGSSNNQVS